MTTHLHILGPRGNPEYIGWFDDFDGDHPYVALSNFYVGEPLFLSGVKDEFMTGEHAFASLKAYHGHKTEQYERIKNSASPGEAKALGQACRLREDWEVVKYDVMMAVIRAKFTPYREEGDVLLETGDALLVEGTYWGDHVWGVALNEKSNPKHAPGRNWLGTMLMARRAELKAEVRFGHAHRTGDFNALFATHI